MPTPELLTPEQLRRQQLSVWMQRCMELEIALSMKDQELNILRAQLAKLSERKPDEATAPADPAT